MKIIHIISKSVNTNYLVTSPFIDFVNNNFDTAEHEFVIVNDKLVPDSVKMYHNISTFDISVKKDFRKILQILKDSDKIILHSLYALNTKNMIRLMFTNWFFKKSFWVEWGGDLYEWKKEILKPFWDPRNILILAKNSINYLFRKKINHFVGIFPPDIDYFKNEFKTYAKTFYAPYTEGKSSHPIYQQQLNLVSLEEKLLKNECINLQIGHSSTKNVNHIDVLNKLVKFKDENIKIYIPLSYGDSEYGNRVEEKAKSMFGNKVVPMRKRIDLELYHEFLATMDIAIFNTHRQIGLGNIHPLLHMQKKIFMPKDSVMYDFYKAEGINVCNYYEISKMDYHSFTNPVDMSGTKEYIRTNVTNRTERIELWNEVFKYGLLRGIDIERKSKH